MGDEVRLGRGFMFWGVKLQLTEEGQCPGRLEGLLGAVHDALAVGVVLKGGLVGAVHDAPALGGWAGRIVHCLDCPLTYILPTCSSLHVHDAGYFWACRMQVVRRVAPEQRRLIFLEAQQVNEERDKRGVLYGIKTRNRSAWMYGCRCLLYAAAEWGH